MPLGPLVTAKPVRLFEFCDLDIFPEYIRARIHKMLHLLWTHHIPYIQDQAAADIAAGIVCAVLDSPSFNTDHNTPTTPTTPTPPNITHNPKTQTPNDKKTLILDFCSGAGGPTAVIEKRVNARRHQRGMRPVYFQLSDLRPQLESWTQLACGPKYLRFVAQPVDAAAPPRAFLAGEDISLSNTVDDYHDKPKNDTEKNNALSRTKGSSRSNRAKVVHLFCLGFHHFDDTTARKVLRNSMNSADAFVIIELQDRHLSSFILLLILTIPLLAVVTPLWCPFDDWGMLFFTYLVPVIPVVLVFDGVVSSLRTRTLEEVVDLVRPTATTAADNSIRGKEEKAEENKQTGSTGTGPLVEDDVGKYQHEKKININGWEFRAGHRMHSWPVGYLNYIIGQRRL
ncbi:hypothetical protein L228DRAFT_250256 [Xylona heveae TC161]|uniref:Uncharacterized protein n=1 Tax=Xylona heveae (strain CBS 132557 / TC161) TaxID=1328760 RepID=A0A165A1M9_XYLHT|nr:hypothetical protein L228DRAFT_250256 [Xylona heveae TC161]KZF19829.1 hypothetical protein L228DRAFT_250256 [Xylona heveae TC161]